MGFVTNLLNPKIAMLYLALLPQFIDPTQDSVLSQSLALGFTQIVISVSVNAADRDGRRIDRAVLGRATDLAEAAALADGHRAGGLGAADGAGDAAKLRPPSPGSTGRPGITERLRLNPGLQPAESNDITRSPKPRTTGSPG